MSVDSIQIITLFIAIISLVLSAISLGTSILWIYLNFFYKRKPFVFCPKLMFFGEFEGKEPLSYINIPLTIFNKGSRVLVVDNMVLTLISDGLFRKNPLVAMKKKPHLSFKKSQDLANYIRNNYISPFDIQKYSSVSEVFTFYDIFLLSNYIKFSTQKPVYISLSVFYNTTKIKKFHWRITFVETNKEHFDKEKNTLISNIFGKECINLIEKKEIKEFVRLHFESKNNKKNNDK